MVRGVLAAATAVVVYYNCHRIEVRDTTTPIRFAPIYYWLSPDVPRRHGNKRQICAALEEQQRIWHVEFPTTGDHMNFGTQEAAERWIEEERCSVQSR